MLVQSFQVYTVTLLILRPIFLLLVWFKSFPVPTGGCETNKDMGGLLMKSGRDFPILFTGSLQALCSDSVCADLPAPQWLCGCRLAYVAQLVRTRVQKGTPSTVESCHPPLCTAQTCAWQL